MDASPLRDSRLCQPILTHTRQIRTTILAVVPFLEPANGFFYNAKALEQQVDRAFVTKHHHKQ